MLKRISFDDRESWLTGRFTQGIGGSEAAAVVGLSPWMTPLQLWRQKLGAESPKEISGNAAVERGHRMEPILRRLFADLHPEFTVEYHQFDVLFQEERPWLFATLDGELLEENGRKGVLEIKTATPTGAKWKDWADGNIPGNYYAQTLHQLLATGYAFVCLFACLYSMNGDLTMKQYEINRDEVQDDLDWLLEKETRFWNRNIIGGVMPGMPLML